MYGDSEILHERMVCNTTRKSEKNEIIREVSRTISCRISESPQHLFPILDIKQRIIYIHTYMQSQNEDRYPNMFFFIVDREPENKNFER